MSAVYADILPVMPAVIQWARSRAGFSVEDAQKYFKKIAAWEAGEAAPIDLSVNGDITTTQPEPSTRR